MKSLLIALLGTLIVAVPCAAQTELQVVRWNDNDRRAGSLEHGVLALDLEVVRASWRFLGEDGPPVEIVAFREIGRAPENPGPMIRAPLGTEIDLTLRNPLDRTLVVHGLSSRRALVMDSLVVPAGETRRVRFKADAEGTYYYWGTTTGTDMKGRVYEDSQLNGVLIVDPPGSRPLPNERIMVLSIWFAAPDSTGEPDFATEMLAMNGRPWPWTERLTYDLGDTVRWRLVNTTDRIHPMHLHGFYFRVDAKGDNVRDEIYWPGQRRMAATELLEMGETAALSWVPDRPGGWIFHCHISYHVVGNAAPGQYPGWKERDLDLLEPHDHGNPHRHVEEGMGGLMMGIYVRPPEGWRPDERQRRALRLFVRSDSLPDQRRRFGFVLADGNGDAPAGPIVWPGSTVVTWKGQPTSVTVINRTAEPTSVHWHGLELDSYYDGVVGVGGYTGMATPAILPGDSFTMRITPPRAGTFMYHTHVHDIRQQSAGLYGAFVILEEGQAWDPETDLTFMLSTDSDYDMSLLLNGTRELAPLTLRAGTPYRLRFMNITLFNAGARVRLVRDGFPVRWTPLAKDGFDLRDDQRRPAFADQVVSVGETYDFEFRSPKAGELHLEVRSFGGELFVSQPIRVIEEPRTEVTSASPGS